MQLSRLKREDCKRTKHDPVFSKWEILIGPSDWEDYSLGKDGVERYRLHNLPIACSCPGLYELGVDAIITDGRRSRKHNPDNIIAVYLGQAENVRTRLQHYGRVGSHLDRGNKTDNLCPKSGRGLFKEIFARGSSIVYRWAPMRSKKEALKTEAQLLGVFDYAWNMIGNGACRREDILLKLDNTINPLNSVLRKLQQWKAPAYGKRAGIKISSSLGIDEVEPSDGWRSLLLPRVLKFIGSRPQSVRRDDELYMDRNICGVALGDGSICRNRPVLQRKRCELHKGKKISARNFTTAREIGDTQVNFSVCGVVLEDGCSLCDGIPVQGRERCESHKGRRVVGCKLVIKTEPGVRLLEPPGTDFQGPEHQLARGEFRVEDYTICGVVLGGECVCRNKPIFGRKRCELHKGQRIRRTKVFSGED